MYQAKQGSAMHYPVFYTSLIDSKFPLYSCKLYAMISTLCELLAADWPGFSVWDCFDTFYSTFLSA